MRHALATRLSAPSAPALSPRGRWLLAGMLAVGLVVRTVWAFATYGVPFDIESFEIVRGALANDPLHLYGIVNDETFNRWPYLSGYLPFVSGAGLIESATGLAFHGLIQLPPILADLGIAWLVQSYLGRHGASEGRRLAAAALVALGPSFVLISGYHGQIDSFAILPGVGAVWLWDRLPASPRRGVAAGLLIGLGIAIKTVPGLLLFALLPHARSTRERLALVGAAAVVPLVLIAPFALADPGSIMSSLTSHRAVPGVGGLSLLVQPEISKNWLGVEAFQLSPLSRQLQDLQTLIAAAALAPFIALVWLRRPPPPVAATLLYLVVYVFGHGFAYQYAVWALPFALMAGYVWQVAAVQAALLVPSYLIYAKPKGHTELIYIPMMIGLWLAIALALGRTALGVLRGRPPARPA